METTIGIIISLITISIVYHIAEYFGRRKKEAGE